ncbi:MAG TPA: carboxypeptidase-like regulatory domain-containing protein [Gemmataceae bacterium]|nr:carboxypeptidase-like regulatory domain-containing protein [Gemmataceae bacterium]
MRLPLVIVRLACLLVAVAVVAVVGCGPSNAKLTGKVTYKGTPLKGGTVTLVPPDGGTTFSATIQEDGTYNFDQVKTGTYKVCVETESLKPPVTAKHSYYDKKGPGARDKSKIKNEPPKGAQIPEGYKMTDPFSGNNADREKRYVAIPADYGDLGKTSLTVEVKGGSQPQQYDIPLS